MKSYAEHLQTQHTQTPCVFCNTNPKEIIDENQSFQVLLARAPYSPDHLLIIPKRHLIYMHELTPTELQDAWSLLQKRMSKLHTDYADINLLLRDGNIGGNIGKSVDHLHFHLIPSIAIGGQESKMRHRPYFSESQYLRLIHDFKKHFSSPEKSPTSDHSYGIIPFIQGLSQEPIFLLIYQKEKFRGFPKGHAEDGETPQQAALRELREETGITTCSLLSDQMQQINYSFYAGKGIRIDKTAYFFVGQLPKEAIHQLHIDQNEVISSRRCTYQEALQLLTHQNSRNLLTYTYTLLTK